MIPEFYKNHLKSQLSTSEFIFLKILINLLQSIKKVNLEQLANALPLPIKFESRRKRIQRFLSLPNLQIEKVWFPIIKTQGFISFNVACKWKRKLLGVAPKEAWFILTNLTCLADAIAAYKRRFDIEEMFRDFKKGGYNLEDTNVQGKRLISLILLMAIAYTSATIQGQQIKGKGLENYVARIKESGRTERRHSSFYIGLYGQTWVNSQHICMELVQELMRLNPNKLKYYQRGLKAMKLVESTF